MYAQQQSTASPDFTETTDLVSGELTCEQVTGNSAAVDAAGLDGAGGQDLSVLGDMADFVLDCLPLAVALPLAARFTDNPTVTAWVERQDTTDVVRAMAISMSDELGAQWPEGMGAKLALDLGAMLGAETGLAGELELMRTAGGGLSARLLATAGLGLADMGVAAKVSGATEDKLVEAGATADFGVECELEGQLAVDFKTSLLVDVLGAQGPMSTVALITAAAAVDLAQAAAGIDLSDHIPVPDLAWEARSRVSTSLKAVASADLIQSLPIDLEAMVAPLAPFLAALDGAAAVSASGTLQLTSAIGGLGLSYEGGVEGLLELGNAGLLGELLDVDALRTLAEEHGGAVKVRFEVAQMFWEGDSLTIDASTSTMSLQMSRTHEGDSETDAITFHPTLLPDVLAGLSQGGVGALLGTTGFSRQVQVAVPDDQLHTFVPDLVGRLAATAGESGPLAISSDVHLEGELTAGPAAMERLAQAGLVAPQDMDPLSAISDVHAALVSLATGVGGLTDWLVPFQGALAEAAQLIELGEARVRGSVMAGVGGRASATGGFSAGMEGRAGAGLVIDQACDPGHALVVLHALADGVVSSLADLVADAAPTCAVDDIQDSGKLSSKGAGKSPATP